MVIRWPTIQSQLFHWLDFGFAFFLCLNYSSRAIAWVVPFHLFQLKCHLLREATPDHTLSIMVSTITLSLFIRSLWLISLESLYHSLKLSGFFLPVYCLPSTSRTWVPQGQGMAILFSILFLILTEWQAHSRWSCPSGSALQPCI